MKKFFVSIPHASLFIPPELTDRIAVGEESLHEMAEAGVEQIFDWPEIRRMIAQAHLCFPNLNRSRDDINPTTHQPYGSALAIFPTADFHGRPIYKSNQELSVSEKESLLIKYYDSFFVQLDTAIDSGKYDFLIDAHAMNSSSTSYGSVEMRSQICLGNRGNKINEEPSFDSQKLLQMQKELQRLGYECSLNEPFSGGYIVQRCRARGFPAFQIEINKLAFMTADSGDLIADKITKLNHDILLAAQKTLV